MGTRHLLRRWRGDRAGNFAILTAIVGPVLIVLAALSVDVGSFFVERREAQGITDLAAISAARQIDRAHAAALDMFADNGFDATQGPMQLTVTPGRYMPDRDVAAQERFQPGATPANAVKVEFSKQPARYFSASLIEAPTIRTAAIARATPEAAFSVGSRLVELEGGIANALLGGLLGTTINLRAMDYRALVQTDVDVLQFVEAAGIELGLTAASYNEVLAARIGIDQLARALAATPGVGLAARTALTTLAHAVPASRTLPLGALLDLGTVADLAVGGLDAGLDASVGALAMVSAAAAIANGENQVAVSLAPSVSGLLDATVRLAIGEPPQKSAWFRVSQIGDVVRTVQTRLRIDLRIGTSTPLLGAVIHVPVFVDLAYGEGRLAAVTCNGGRESRVATVDARPGVAELHIGDVDISRMHDFSRRPNIPPAEIVDVYVNLLLVRLKLATITARAEADATNSAPTPLRFNHREIETGVVKTVSTKETLDTLTSSLLGNLHLEPKLLSLRAPLPNEVFGLTRDLLAPLTPALDQILNAVLGLLGISIGDVDVRVMDAHCGRSVLVQ